jgi:lipase ATG15
MDSPSHHACQRPCRAAGRITAHLLLSFLALSSTPTVAAWTGPAQQIPLLPYLPPTARTDSKPAALIPQKQEFTLRHVFHRGTHRYPDLYRRFDVPKEEISAAGLEGRDEMEIPGPFTLGSASMNIQRMVNRRIEDIEPLLSAARFYGEAVSLPASAWTTDEILGPDVTDKETVVNMALIAANAYGVNSNATGDWEDAKQGFNKSNSFGWEDDGLRGHVFANDDNSTIVLAIKGTTMAVFDGTETTSNDKENDNLFGSCCCGQGGHYLYRQVCDCMTSTYTCNTTCVVQALRQKNRYYQASLELYGNATALFPNSSVWLTGHSLGGAGMSYSLRHTSDPLNFI